MAEAALGDDWPRTVAEFCRRRWLRNRRSSSRVMSPWSEVDDTPRKWFSYRKIPSLTHYLVVAQDRREVLVHSRAGEFWRERFVSEGAIGLDDPPVAIELAVLYVATDLAA